MKIKDKNRIIFFVIILLAFLLRFYSISSVPPSASLDEASIGYNAYSILHTGKDEYGNSFPILLRAYDDWRPGLYVYLVVPFLSLFGLSSLSVRLPSALMSIFTVYLAYRVVRELFGKERILAFGKQISTEYLALLASFLLAISPWHIYLSRLGHEVNLGLTAFLLGSYFFIRAMQNAKKRESFILSSIFFVLSLYGYQSQKTIVPVVLLGGAILFRTVLIKQWKTVFVSFLVGLIVLLPLIFASSNPQALIRFKATSAFSGVDYRYQESAEKILEAKENGDVMSEILNNRRLIVPKILINNYVSHFSPLWLFTNSGNEQHKVPNLGLLYIWESVFIGIGFFVFLLSNMDLRYKTLIMLWFFSSPLAAAITTGAPHAMRSYTFLPLWQIFSAIGLISTYYYFQKYISGKILIFLFSVVSLLSVIYFAYNYYVVFPKTQSSSFQYALSKAILYAKQVEKEYPQIIFSNRDNLYQSYMFFLFYTKYDPKRYLSDGGTKSGGFAETHTIGKYRFQPVDYSEIPMGALIVGNNLEIPQTASTLQTIPNLDGAQVIVIAEK